MNASSAGHASSRAQRPVPAGPSLREPPRAVQTSVEKRSGLLHSGFDGWASRRSRRGKKPAGNGRCRTSEQCAWSISRGAATVRSGPAPSGTGPRRPRGRKEDYREGSWLGTSGSSCLGSPRVGEAKVETANQRETNEEPWRPISVAASSKTGAATTVAEAPRAPEATEKKKGASLSPRGRAGWLDERREVGGAENTGWDRLDTCQAESGLTEEY